MAAPTWLIRELPILERIHELEEAGEDLSGIDAYRSLGLDDDVVVRTIHLLVTEGYAQGMAVPDSATRIPWYLELRLTGKGRREVGQWPQKAVDAFVQRLDQLIAAETDEDRRGRLARLRSALSEVPAQVVGGLIVAAAEAGAKGVL